MSIDTREELINALREACEIEHGLMVQYLYTGLTMKRSGDDGLTAAQQVKARQWLATIMEVAQDEMGHLAMVCHLLSAIGGTPKFHRPNMPLETGYYPFKFDLLPFGDEALYRFMVFELPRGFPLPTPPVPAEPEADALILEGVAPDPLTFEYVGELYERIAAGFSAIPEADLFLRPHASGAGDWGPAEWDRQVSDRASALATIEWIIEQGEGSPDAVERSHFQLFSEMRDDFAAEGRFAVAKAVPVNPATRVHRDAQGPVTLIENEASRDAVELFNAVYAVMLLILQHHFAILPTGSSETSAERRRRAALRDAAKHLMSTAVRPLAEIVSDLPLGEDDNPLRAGPSFEIYSDVVLSPHPEIRDRVLLERFAPLVDAAAELGTSVPRSQGVSETLSLIRRNLAIGFGEGA